MTHSHLMHVLKLDLQVEFFQSSLYWDDLFSLHSNTRKDTHTSRLFCLRSLTSPDN